MILSDSTGLPRPYLEPPDRTTLEDLYGHIAEERLRPEHEVHLWPAVGLDSDELIARSYPRIVGWWEADLVVLHFGIIDCAPRLFRKNNRSILLRPWFRRLTRDVGLRAMKKYRPLLTRVSKRQYVPVDRFRENLESIVDQIRESRSGTRVLAISIVKVADWLDARSHAYNEEVARYNEVIRDVVGADSFIDVDALGEEPRTISDGYHLRSETHAALAEEIVARVRAMSEGRN